MKSVVGILGFSGGKWLEMRMFDGLMGWFRLGGQTVDSYGCGRTFSVIYALTAISDSAVNFEQRIVENCIISKLEQIIRLKSVLIEQKRKGKWLAESITLGYKQITTIIGNAFRICKSVRFRHKGIIRINKKIKLWN